VWRAVGHESVTTLRRVLIANRGEVAVRIIRACRELGLETVAVYSTADRDSLHVRLAERAVHIGPPHPAQSYLSIPSLVAAATTTGCDAVHPGWGFLAENADFARACEENDLVFVGPRPESIETMGDKIQAKEAAARAGVPLVPGSEGAATLEQARELGASIGFPLLLKAAAGGGGRGMRLVHRPEELDAAYSTASAEAEAAFSDPSLYVEKAVVDARHVEIQVLGDGEGGVLTLGERDCSIQRRHQKLVEEAPSPALTPELRAEMEGVAARACETLRYRGAGTIEFLVDRDRRFYFIEMNTRLQVEHPVTELLTGIDLAQAQLRVAGAEPLPQTGRAELRGHAIEIRINAEDPAHDFRPAPGTVTRFRPPLGPGVRVDTHVEEGYRIPPFYDSLIAKVIVWAEDRPRAIGRCARALEELVLEGVPTTRELALDILRSDAFASGDYTTGFLAEAAAELPGLKAA
jgi:acetyl-CoA carboxylase, biotin carboxylase subunit